MAQLLGYARVSTNDQDLAMQIDELKAAGCSAVFTDKVSGAKSARPGLDQCLAVAKVGDTIVCWRLDRLGRSMQHLVSVITNLKERGIGFRSLKDGLIDTGSASGELIFHIFAALAQFERALIRERTKAGLSAARARGRLGGRRPISADDPKVSLATRLYLDKSMSINEVCTILKVSRSTLFRYLALKTRPGNG